MDRGESMNQKGILVVVSGFAGTGGAVENHVGYFAAVYYVVKNFPLSENMLLPYNISKGLGTYSVCQWTAHYMFFLSKRDL